MSEKYPFQNDVAVLIIFFCRDKQLAQVFEQVKKARPSRLYLYQDGARSGNQNDVDGIMRCRNIVSEDNINWDCQVHRMYQDKNVGCDPSEYIAQKWMFENEEMGIILEDDDVPSQSFFPFCAELLKKYKDDPRINMICGMNNNDVTEDISESYLFSKHGSIWGWASWRRVLDTWDASYKWLDDPQALAVVKEQFGSHTKSYQRFIETATGHRQSGRAHYESINAASLFLQDRVNIVPKYNMIKNVGIDANTTHGVSDLRLLARETRHLFYKKAYEIDFPLVHPETMDIHKKFDKTFEPTAWHGFRLRAESLLRRMYYNGIGKTLKEHLQKKRKHK